ncbi:MAG: hypothetical protein HKN13_09705, partial [Rhodothermales bacterium]|nr:hypothetical protein [Rhodothermales bacterium]
NGSAAQVGTVAQLTNGGSSQRGSVWSTSAVEIRNFEVDFTFLLTPNSPPKFADGFTFAIQGFATTALGCGGGCLGYAQGVPQSVALKFDTWPTNGTTGLYSNGAYPNENAPDSIDLTSSGINLRSTNVFEVHLTYDGTTLHQEITDTVTSATFVRNYTVDIPALVGGNVGYVGFTGATGGQTSIQDIQTFVYQADQVPYDVTFTSLPKDYELLPRDRDTNSAEVLIEGVEKLGGLAEAVLRVYRDDIQVGSDEVFTLNYISGEAPFTFAATVPAELALYDFEVLVRDGIGGEFLVSRAEDIVAGDVIIIQGQSNADARLYSGSSGGYINPYVRTYGINSSNAAITEAAVEWSVAVGDGSRNVASGIGQWGLVMGNLLSARTGVPIAVINGAHGGQPISFFQRNDGNPDDTTTNYGRLLHRMQAAGIDDDVRALLYYQGENDSGDFATHEAGYLDLRDDWYADYPGIEELYVNQLREGCGVTRFDVGLRNTQRQFGHRFPDVSVMSVNSLDGHDGCHFFFANGYETLGMFYDQLLARDLYGAVTGADTEAPDIGWAELVGSGNDVVRLHFRNTSDTYSFDSGAEDDFSVAGLPGGVTITGGSIATSGDAIDLQLSGDGSGATSVSYTGRAGSGAWITNADGIGLLAFVESLAPDSTPPVIAILGPNPQSLECGSSYVEWGATAVDDFDGHIGGWIDIDTSGLNLSSPGNYVVTY